MELSQCARRNTRMGSGPCAFRLSDEDRRGSMSAVSAMRDFRCRPAVLLPLLRTIVAVNARVFVICLFECTF
jgi:hypothetical protein